MESRIADPKVQSVLSKLRFLSKIDKHEKLDVSSLSLVADTWWTSFYRTIKTVAASQGIYWMNNESRKISLTFIETTTEEALELAKELLSREQTLSKSLNHNLGLMIIAALDELDLGIENLKKTYDSDKMFVSQIEAFQKILKVQISDLKRTSIGVKIEEDRIYDDG